MESTKETKKIICEVKISYNPEVYLDISLNPKSLKLRDTTKQQFFMGGIRNNKILLGLCEPVNKNGK